MGNGAIVANGHPIPHAVNGGVSDIAITTHGSDWYYVWNPSPCEWPSH